MTIEIATHELAYRKPVDEGAFLAALNGQYEKSLIEVRDTFKIYGAVAARIVRERELISPEYEWESRCHWDFVGWAGLLVMINLGRDEGFDAVHDYYEYLSFQTRHCFAPVELKDRVWEPEPSDFADIGRRSWQFKVGKARCTLSAIAHYNSNVCKRVEDGTQPTYKLVCEGSPL